MVQPHGLVGGLIVERNELNPAVPHLLGVKVGAVDAGSLGVDPRHVPTVVLSKRHLSSNTCAPESQRDLTIQ